MDSLGFLTNFQFSFIGSGEFEEQCVMDKGLLKLLLQFFRTSQLHETVPIFLFHCSAFIN
jgi:hypothetical protein